MPRKNDHVHKFMKVMKKKGYMWRCAISDCTWFVHQGLENTITGKPAICWQCGKTFTMDDDAMREDMPTCYECRGKVYTGGTKVRLIEPVTEGEDEYADEEYEDPEQIRRRIKMLSDMPQFDKAVEQARAKLQRMLKRQPK